MDPLFAFLAQLAYKSPAERKELLRKSNYGLELELDEHLNFDEFATVISKSGSMMYNVHRGTVNKDDVGTDLALAANRLEETDRFRRSLNWSNAALTKYKDRTSMEVGHSLGGTLAQDIAIRNGTYSMSFNMGTTPLRDYSGINRERFRHYRMTDDFVSQFDQTANGSISKPNPLQAVLRPLPAWNFFQPILLAERVATAWSSHGLANFGVA